MDRVVALHAGPQRLAKTARERLELARDGARGDRHFGRDPDRAVLLTTDASYREMARRGLGLPYGSLGENLVLEIDDATRARLLPGARVQIGGALLEIVEPCAVCATLARVHPSLPKLARGRRGLYARVVMGGPVTLGDEIVWFPEAQLV